MTARRVLRDVPRKFWGPLMDAARAFFGRRNRFGVHSYGIGPHVEQGIPTQRRTLNVYVVRKFGKPKHPVPKLSFRAEGKTWELEPNVIATGRLPYAALGGGGEFSGLHAGAVIAVQGPKPLNGALACIFSKSGTPTHALTAGHLFPPGATGSSVFAAPSATAAVRAVGTLVANYLDSPGTDAALIELNAAGQALITTDGPALTDPITGATENKVVRAFLATSNDFSRQVTTGSGPQETLLTIKTRGTYLVRNAITTDGEVTLPGDSGTILCTGASNELAVGLCSGAQGAQSIFTPFEAAFELAVGTAGPLEIF